MVNLQGSSALLGMQMVGGGNKMNNKDKLRQKLKELSTRFQYMGGFGGAEFQMDNDKMPVLGGAKKRRSKTTRSLNNTMQLDLNTWSNYGEFDGGKKDKKSKPKAAKPGKAGEMTKSQYKKYLKNLPVTRLYDIARGKKVDLYTKRNGKTYPVKKATIISKLVEKKFGA